MQKFKVNGQSIPKIEWKQTDGHTDGGDRITSLANSVRNKPECSDVRITARNRKSIFPKQKKQQNNASFNIE